MFMGLTSIAWQCNLDFPVLIQNTSTASTANQQSSQRSLLLEDRCLPALLNMAMCHCSQLYRYPWIIKHRCTAQQLQMHPLSEPKQGGGFYTSYHISWYILLFIITWAHYPTAMLLSCTLTWVQWRSHSQSRRWYTHQSIVSSAVCSSLAQTAHCLCMLDSVYHEALRFITNCNLLLTIVHSILKLSGCLYVSNTSVTGVCSFKKIK